MKYLFILSMLVSSLFSMNLDYFFKSNICGEKNKIINKQIYKICYDTQMKGPKFVGYTLDGNLVNKGNYKKRPSFYTEKNLKKRYRTTNSDFSYTGLDKGHMANHADFDNEKNLKRVRKTYSLANISPQYPVVNRKLWLKAEMAERSNAKRLGKLNVLNIVIYDNPYHYLQRIPLEEAIKLNKKRKKDKFKKWTSYKINKYINNSKKTLKKKIVIPTEYFKVMWNDKYKFKKCYKYENKKNLKSKGDKLKYHIISCKKILKRFNLKM